MNEGWGDGYIELLVCTLNYKFPAVGGTGSPPDGSGIAHFLFNRVNN